MRLVVSFTFLFIVLAACVQTEDLQDSGSYTPEILGHYVRVEDGTKLPIKSWLPNGQIKAIILSLHGFNDYSSFFSVPGSILATDYGIASYAYDQRGFGRTKNVGTWAGIKTYVGDARSVIFAIKQRHPHTPIYLLGESMGGAISILLMTSDDPPNLKGTILLAPAVWGDSAMPILQKFVLWVSAHTVPWLKVSGRGLGIKPSDNKEMLLALGRDPLVIKETRVDTIFGLVKLMDEALKSSSRFLGPSLTLYGEKDEVIPIGPIIKMRENLPRKEILRHGFAFYRNGYHMLSRDLQAPIVINDIASWINRPTHPLPSKADRRRLQMDLKRNGKL